MLSIWDGSKTSRTYFEYTSSEQYDTRTFPMHNVQTDGLRFHIYWHASNKYYFARIEPYGCYNTSTPTTVPTPAPTKLPTTSTPTKLPTILPTISPTLPPVTTYPTKTPSVLPTTAPTESPSVDNPSTYPSISPTWSPTEAPSNSEAPSPIPSRSPSSSPTVVYIDRGFHVTVGRVELLIIVIVSLCGVIFFLFRRYKKVSEIVNNFKNVPESEMQIVNNFENVHESKMQIVPSHDIEEAGMKITNKNWVSRKADMEKTHYNEGEGQEKKERIQAQVMPEQTAEFRFGLDKVTSNISEL